MTMPFPEEPSASSTPTAQRAASPVTSPPDVEVVTLDQPPSPAWPREIGGRGGPEPTRYGDWEKAGRCIDF
jgi:hypothetical protein